MGVGDTNVHVQVNGTTFSGIYEAIGPTVELTSADFGDRSAEPGGENPRTVAERMLRAMAEDAMRSSSIPFLRDNGTVAVPTKVTKGADN